MKAKEFFTILENNKDKDLLFEYAHGLHVGANYHITEVKHASIDAVDCGAQTDAWRETIIQLWESPDELDKTEYMSVYKALSILKRVERMKPFDWTSELKFEYGNASFHTAHLFVNDFETRGNHLIFNLSVEKTDCKARSLCGVTDSNGAELCIESEIAHTDMEPCCSPGGNCC
ncbi:DUF6428 family protein [Aestuariivivens sediminicola]|uniref:DUF6428 family protein n=1 Tax=Aestuariivivens sediminicola TaxID=2913560 RepID=UPI001F55BE6C|nr:DUF6428 family protein [Aestuariivivens sediminicola]